MADLITLAELKTYIGEPVKESSEADGVLDAVKAAASELVRTHCSRQFDQAAHSEIYNGRGRRSIHVRETPVAASPAPTATENGTALVVATAYSATADVIVDLVNGVFSRMPGTSPVESKTTNVLGVWQPGTMNVSLGYTGGYVVASVPADLKLVVKYLANMFWIQADREYVGVSQRSTGGQSTSFLDDLPALYKGILERYRRQYLPEQ